MLFNTFKTIFFVGLFSLFIIGCGGGSTAGSGGGATNPLPSKAGESTNTGGSTGGKSTTDPIKFPSAPSDCASDCPPAFPAT